MLSKNCIILGVVNFFLCFVLSARWPKLSFPIQQLFIIIFSLLLAFGTIFFDSLNCSINFNKKMFNSISRRKNYKSVALSLIFSLHGLNFSILGFFLLNLLKRS